MNPSGIRMEPAGGASTMSGTRADPSVAAMPIDGVRREPSDVAPIPTFLFTIPEAVVRARDTVASPHSGAAGQCACNRVDPSVTGPIAPRRPRAPDPGFLVIPAVTSARGRLQRRPHGRAMVGKIDAAKAVEPRTAHARRAPIATPRTPRPPAAAIIAQTPGA